MAVATPETQPYTEADLNDFAHCGPDTLMGRYLRTFWHPIYVSNQLEPGYAVPVRLMNEDFTLYRGEGGVAHMIAFRCAHRGTQLSTGFVEDDAIRCRYHGWVFDGNGQCVDQPLENPSFASRIRIGGYPVEEYLGLIFVYIGEGDPPPLPRYPRMEREGLLEWAFAPRACNFFNELENDPEHVPFTHRDPKTPRGQYNLADRVDCIESNWGIAQHRHYGSDFTLVVQHGMPNIRSTAHGPTAEVFRFKVPIDDGNLCSFEVELYQMSAEEAEKKRLTREHAIGGDNDARAVLTQEILAGKKRLLDFDRDPPDGISMFNLQDDVTQVGQGVIADRQHEHLGSSDAYVVLLRQIFKRELKAFAEGRPLKHWELTDDLVNTARRGRE